MPALQEPREPQEDPYKKATKTRKLRQQQQQKKKRENHALCCYSNSLRLRQSDNSLLMLTASNLYGDSELALLK